MERLVGIGSNLLRGRLGVGRRSSCSGVSRRLGFTLIEVAMVLVIIGILATLVGTVSVSAINEKRRNDTKEKIKNVDAALVAFVVQKRRLPCPADGTVASSDGTESCAAILSTANQKNGVVPWKTLGLTLADVMDGWGNLFTYRVDPTSALYAGALDLTYCSPAGTSAVASGVAGAASGFCNTGCLSSTFPGACTKSADAVKSGALTLPAPVVRGLEVRDASSVAASTKLADPTESSNNPPGAAYVLISHGENQNGAFTSSGSVVSGVSPSSSAAESQNQANNTYVSGNPSATYLVDGAIDYSATTSHFDDFVSRPSILTVATKASLGPRAY